MLRWRFILPVLMIVAVLTYLAAFAEVTNNGGYSVAAGITTIERTFVRYSNDAINVHNLRVFPHSADVFVVLHPESAAAVNDTITVRAGTVLPIYGANRIDGFTVIRPAATIVDAVWWP